MAEPLQVDVRFYTSAILANAMSCHGSGNENLRKREEPMAPSWIWATAQNELQIASWRMLVIASAGVITVSTAAAVLATYLL